MGLIGQLIFQCAVAVAVVVTSVPQDYEYDTLTTTPPSWVTIHKTYTTTKPSWVTLTQYETYITTTPSLVTVTSTVSITVPCTSTATIPPQYYRISPQDCFETKDCFFLYSASQCLCWIRDNATNPVDWLGAQQECKHRGLELPHPVDIVALRSAMFQNCGNCGGFWLNAKTVVNPVLGPPYIMQWQDNKREITSADPFFAPPPPTFTANECLETQITTAAISGPPHHPYVVKGCDKKNNIIVCEKTK